MFKKYTSLIRVDNQKEIDFWVSKFPELLNCKYIVSEKIDGANFQFYFKRVDKDEPYFELHCGRRTAFLEPGERFFGYENYVENLLEKFGLYRRVNNIFLFDENVFYDFSSIAMAANQFRIFCEFFGDGINSRVCYREKGFRIIDIEIGNEFLSQKVLYYLFGNKFCVPFLGTANGLDNALAVNNNFKSSLTPSGFQQKENAEGIVIRPFERNYKYRGEYFILKNVHDSFKERKKIKKPVNLEEIKLKREKQDLFLNYVNKNRVLNVFSKHGPLEKVQDIKSYIKMVLDDAKEDFTKDHGDDFESWVFGKGGAQAAKLLKEFLQGI